MAKPKQTPRYETQPSEGPLWASEPFRVFFPLGLLASAAGALLWPCFYWGLWPMAPHLQHPRLMAFGFGGAFVCGFLGTAWPRFLEAEALRRGEVLLMAALWLTSMAFYLAHSLASGDLAFGLFTLALLAVLGRRLRRDRDLPPPGFALALAAVALGCAVAFCWAAAPGWLTSSAEMSVFTRLVAYQGMLLLPLLGVGSYLFARFFQVPGTPPPTARPRQRALGVWVSASLVLVSFAVEAAGMVRAGSALRLLAIVLWLTLAAPALWRSRAPTTRAWALRLAIGSIAATFAIRMFWPGPAYALAHLLFLGGFGLALLLIADRVSHGHGGDMAALPARSRLWRWIAWLALLTATTRVSADLKLSLLISHHIYAALSWVVIVGLWALATAPLWWRRGK